VLEVSFDLIGVDYFVFLSDLIDVVVFYFHLVVGDYFEQIVVVLIVVDFFSLQVVYLIDEVVF